MSFCSLPKKKETPSRGFLFLFGMVLSVFGVPETHAQEVEGRLWLEALDYLKARKASSEIDTLRQEALKARPHDWELAQAFLETLLGRKDRVLLHDYIFALASAQGCIERTTTEEAASTARRPRALSTSKFCVDLRELWQGRLSNLLFYEASAPRWERARRALEAKDCRLAQAELREIEAREGAFPDLISQKILAAQCLGDLETTAGLERELEKLRF